MVLSKLKESFKKNKGDKKMKVAILGAGCYRTHAASGITNFSRACEVAEATGKENISMTHSTIEMGAELLELAGVDEVVVSDPIFDGDFVVVDDFDYAEVIAAHKAGNLRSVQTAPMPRDAAAQKEQDARMAKLTEAADKTKRVFESAGRAATERADALARVASAEGA